MDKTQPTPGMATEETVARGLQMIGFALMAAGCWYFSPGLGLIFIGIVLVGGNVT